MKKNIKLSFILIYLSICTFSFAQNKTEDVLDRSKPPEIKKTIAFKLPAFKEEKLPNGITFVVNEEHSQPIVSVVISINSGSSEDSENPGLSSILCELLTKGTKTNTSEKIANLLDFNAVEYDIFSNYDACFIKFTVLKKNLNPALDILSDCIQNSIFLKEELEKVKERKISELKHKKNEPYYLSEVIFNKTLYKNHPYSNDIGGTEESINALSQESILKYYKKYFAANNCSIVVSGDVSFSETKNLLNTYFGQWSNNPDLKFTNLKVNIENKRKVVIVDRPNSVQSSIRIGEFGIEKGNINSPSLNVLSTYLGGYFRSQLNLNLREKNGYTYGASCYFDGRKEIGPFVIQTEVGTEVTSAAIKEILTEIDSIFNKEISNERLNEVKSFFIGSFPLQLQQPIQICNIINTLKLYNLPDDYYNNMFQKVQNMNGSDLIEIAKNYFNKNNFLIVISGDAEKISKELEQFGEVEIYNTNMEKILRRHVE